MACCAGVAQQIYGACAQSACELLLHSGEDNIIQSACEFFRKLLAVGGEQLLTWAPRGPPQALHMLVLVRPPPAGCSCMACSCMACSACWPWRAR